MDENKIPEGMNEQETASQNAESASPVESATAIAEPEAPKAEETAQERAASEVSAQQEPETPKKSKFPIVLVVVICVLVIAIIAVFASGLLSNPEKAVDKAFEATSAEIQARSEKVAGEIPAMKLLSDPQQAARQTEFDFSFDSAMIDGTDSMELAMINAMFEGSGIRGNWVSDPESSVAEIDASLHIGDTDLVGLYAYLSPELVAGNIPAFSDAVLSINPKTFSEDYKASVLYDPTYDTDEDLQEMQDVINGIVDSVGAYSKMDAEKMSEEIYAIIGKVMDNATYEKGPKDGALKSYTISIPGEDVQACLTELVNYMYKDSEMADFYKALLEPVAVLEGQTYQEFIDEMLGDLNEEVPPMDTTLVIKVDGSDIIRNAALTMTIPASDDGTTEPSDIIVNYALAEDGSETIDMTMRVTDSASGMPVDMAVNIKDSYADGIYNVDCAINMDQGGVVIEETITMMMDKEGAFNIGLDINMPDAYGEDYGMRMYGSMEGTIQEDSGSTVYDYPAIKLGMDAMGQNAVLNFTAKATSSPLDGAYTISKQVTPLFSMSEEELYTELQKYDDGISALSMQLYSILFGVDLYDYSTPELIDPAVSPEPVTPAA